MTPTISPDATADSTPAPSARRSTNHCRAAGAGRVWINSEFETLQLLHAAGANVPEPISCSGNAIRMEFIGDGPHAAPMLRVAMTSDESRECLRQILENVALWLRCDRIHGDLSVYNVLYRDGRIVAIDFPQAATRALTTTRAIYLNVTWKMSAGILRVQGSILTRGESPTRCGNAIA